MMTRRLTISRPVRRRGLTILEVILSIGIFLAASTVITQLIGTGARAAVSGRYESQAALLAESKMAEVVAGAQELIPGNDQSFRPEETEDAFTWSLIVDETGQGDLMQVTVEVRHTNPQRQVDAEFALSRYIRDPQIYIDAATAEEE